jgi:preprotein translocase subunit SecE
MTRHKKSRSERKEERAQKRAREEALSLATPGKTFSPPPKAKPKKPEYSPPGKISRAISFFKEAKRELTHVTWPTRPETVKATGVLLIFVGISAIYLGVVDGILTRILRLIID